MNLDAATATLRALAIVAGVPNADSVTITVTPYKGYGERSHRKGWRVATAVGWPSRDFPSDRRSSQLTTDEFADDAAAVDELVRIANLWAEFTIEDATAEEQRLLDEARKATEAAKALNVEARRAALLAVR